MQKWQHLESNLQKSKNQRLPTISYRHLRTKSFRYFISNHTNLCCFTKRTREIEGHTLSGIWRLDTPSQLTPTILGPFHRREGLFPVAKKIQKGAGMFMQMCFWAPELGSSGTVAFKKVEPKKGIPHAECGTSHHEGLSIFGVNQIRISNPET